LKKKVVNEKKKAHATRTDSEQFINTKKIEGKHQKEIIKDHASFGWTLHGISGVEHFFRTLECDKALKGFFEGRGEI